MTSTNKVPTRTPSRDRVFDVIDGECEYFAENYSAVLGPSPGDALLEIEQQLAHAKSQWSRYPEGQTATINELRKIAGIAVRALELLGPIPREYHIPASANITGTLQGRDKNDKL